MKIKNKIKDLLDNENFRNILHDVLNSIFSAIIGCLITLIFKNYIAIILGLIIILVFMLVVSIFIMRNESMFNLMKILKNDQKKGNWKEIIRLAYPLSRPLWLSRKYKLRVELGKLIDEACIHLNASPEKYIMVNNEKESISSIRSSILIDDLGWTLYKLGRHNADTAKENIEKGISIAEQTQEFDKIIKGYRHLSGIASELEEDRGVIESYQQKMLEILQSSEYEQNVSEEDKNLALAGAYYSFARENVRFAKKETEWNEKEQLLDVSNHFIELVSEIYREKDLDRYAKTYFVKSEILMLYNDINKLNQAKDLLKEGLVFCQEQQRRDNFIRISILLIKLNVQKMQMRAFHKMELEEIWKESKVIYNNVIQEISNHDYDNEYKKEIEELMEIITQKYKESD